MLCNPVKPRQRSLERTVVSILVTDLLLKPKNNLVVITCWIARADILFRAGHTGEAQLQLRQAIEASENTLERRVLKHRLLTVYKE